MSKWHAVSRLRSDHGLEADDPAPGRSFTEAEYSREFGLPQTTAGHQIARLVRLGELNVGTKRVKDSRGRSITVRCFWTKEEHKPCLTGKAQKKKK